MGVAGSEATLLRSSDSQNTNLADEQSTHIFLCFCIAATAYLVSAVFGSTTCLSTS